ncbi:MAG TPA: hypothetical protein VMZ11_06895 [Mycobacteriales bacterium]|nr:hypothetical protein [Mycobacteriales bacterium]
MRRTAAVLACLAVVLAGTTAVALPTAPVRPMVVPVPALSQVSSNVRHLGTIPLEGVGVSMRTVKVGSQVRAFVSGAAGLSIYDATDPRDPRLLGHLPIYNWENEDIAVSRDGSTAILTEFTSSFYLHVIDVSDPTLPLLEGTLPLKAAHTVQCADPRCDYAFGSEGQTFDLRVRSHPVLLPEDRGWGTLTGAGHQGHALHQDAAGYWVSDTMPLVMFKQAPDPFHLKVLTKGAITRSTAYQHNNVRPRAERWKPRAKGASAGGPLRDGELLLGEGETNTELRCGDASGAFSTWSLVDFDKGRKMRQLDVLRPVSGPVGGHDPAVNVLGCSGHWFSTRDGADGSILVAAAWYEHGTRFLSVDPRTGRISQRGWFQPHRGSTSAAYWMGKNTVWSVDYHSGIDVLAFDERASLLPTADATRASWMSKAGVVDPLSAALRRLCRAGADATHEDHARLRSLLG